jgi:uncharacterized protein
MQLCQFDKIEEFWLDAQAYLLKHEAENNVLLNVVDTLLHNPDRYPETHYLATVKEDNGDILAVAIRTPPRKLLLSKVSNLDALTLIARHLEHEQLPGVMGLLPEVETFLQTWQGLTGASYKLVKAMKIHQLTAVNDVATTNGYLRLADERDRSILTEWLPAFVAEIGDVMDEDPNRAVDNRLKTQSTYIWENDLAVSLVAGRQFSPGVGRIGPVYTPPAYRQKGYATACVAALSQKLLNEGCDRCFLLTDLANPTSNHIYRKIGYLPICDWNEYSFIKESI